MLSAHSVLERALSHTCVHETVLSAKRRRRQTSAAIHSTRSPPPRLRRLLTASRCLRFHSRVSSPRAVSHRARIRASSSVRPKLTLRMRPVVFERFGKKSGKVESRALDPFVAAGVGAAEWLVAVGLDVAIEAGAGALFARVGSPKSRSRSRSRSESRLRWPIKEKPGDRGPVNGTTPRKTQKAHLPLHEVRTSP
jgi:hypothetical protein